MSNSFAFPEGSAKPIAKSPGVTEGAWGFGRTNKLKSGAVWERGYNEVQPTAERFDALKKYIEENPILTR